MGNIYWRLICWLMGSLLICARRVSSRLGIKALRRAKVGIPVSETAMNDVEIFNLFLEISFMVYALLCRSVDFYPELKQSIQEGFKERSLLLFSAFATVSGMLQYCGYSPPVFVPTLAGGLLLLIHTVKPAWTQDEPLFLMFLLLLTCCDFPQIALFSVAIQVPCFHFHVIEPYSKDLFLTSHVATQIYGKRKYLEIVSAILGTAVMAYYLRFPSEDLILALGLFSIATLISFAFIKPCTDFGIIQFLVVSGIQCVVTVYGLLHLFTCLAVVGGCGILFVRRMVEIGQYPKLVISFLERMKVCFHPENRLRWEVGLCPFKIKMIKLVAAIVYIGTPYSVMSPGFRTYRLGHPFLAMSINSLYFALWGWRLLSKNGYVTYQSVWERWQSIIGIGGGCRTLLLYVRFRDVLHVFVLHMGRLQMNQAQPPLTTHELPV